MRKERRRFMCDHKKDDGKKEVFISGLCRECAEQERFDQKQLQELILTQAMKSVEIYRKVFLKT